AFGSKLTAAEAFETCWMAWRGSTPLAYLVSLPACLESLPALDAPHWMPQARPRLLYLHDMAVAPEARALGLAGRLLAQAEQRAGVLGLAELALVAVQGSEPYWQRRGFATLGALPARLAAKLTSFGEQARFMRRQLA
ncbi:MAG TPA: GNAT family N-acetyltransferase, partial [Roseateles sp.]|nr:GNAT family N-acetyltransferase [Roseateles sp.]